jgi:hypothetical protein
VRVKPKFGEDYTLEVLRVCCFKAVIITFYFVKLDVDPAVIISVICVWVSVG